MIYNMVSLIGKTIVLIKSSNFFLKYQLKLMYFNIQNQ